MNNSPKSHITKEGAKDLKMFKIGDVSFMYSLILSASLRPGELLALKWDNTHSYRNGN